MMLKQDRKMKLSRLLQILILLCAVIGILFIGPLHLVSDKVMSVVEETGYQPSEGIVAEEQSVMQQFIPEYHHVDHIQVLVDSLGVEEGNFRFTFYDQELNVLWETVGLFSLHPGVDYHTFEVNQDVKPGVPYYYRLDYAGTAFVVGCQPRTQGIENSNGAFYMNLEEVPNMSAVTKYQYDVPLSGKKVVIGGIGLICLAAICCAVLELTEKKKRNNRNKNIDEDTSKSVWNREVSLKTAGGVMLSTILVAAAVYVVECICVNHIFADNWLDNGVLSLGVILFTTVCIYGILSICHGAAPCLQKTEVIYKWKTAIPNILQVVFWALALGACCDFVNAGSNYAQGLALREMCSYFAMAVITMFTKKELVNIWNGIYAVLAVIACIIYVRPFVGQGEPYETAIRTAIMFALAGVIILSTIYNLIHKKWARFSLPFTGLIAVFFAMLLVFRNGILWEVAVVVPFGLLYIRSMTTKQRNQMIHNIANGVVLSFALWIYESLKFRPFHYFVLVRYEGMFMTVTVAAVYLSLVLAVATTKLWIAYHRNPTFRGIWKELVLFGTAAGFQFLTLSRTGIMTSVAVYLVALGLHIVFRWKEKRTKIPYLLKYIGYSVLAILCCIPIVYTAARTVPAMVNKPFIYLGEEFEDSIRIGEPWNSYRYITVSKFMGISSERILGKKDLSHMTMSGLTVEEVLEKAQENMDDETAALLEESGVQVTEKEILYTDEYGSNYAIDAPDYSNGRLAIFKEYISRLNFTGHDAVAITLEDGSILAHAHNSFLQMAYDCGIFTGIVFVIVYLVFGFRSLWYYAKRKDIENYAMLPVVIFATFGISSMVEYVFRPTIPLGFVFLLMIAPLLVRPDKEEKIQEKTS